MIATYRLNAEELNANILAAIKQTFKNKTIEVNIRTIDAKYSLDELVERAENVKNGADIIQLSPTEFDTLVTKNKK